MTRMKYLASLGIAASAVLTGTGPVAAGEPAHAAPATEPTLDLTGLEVSLNGKPVDIKEVWAKADACKLLSGKEMICFPTAAEADAWNLAQAKASGGAAVQSSGPIDCSYSGSLFLWADTNYGGDRLELPWYFSGWVDLGPLGFNDRMSSWKNVSCISDFGYENYNGGASMTFYRGYQVDWVGSYWNDRVSAAYMVAT